MNYYNATWNDGYTSHVIFDTVLNKWYVAGSHCTFDTPQELESFYKGELTILEAI